ncbi:eukaryotic translation initiation factor 2 beta [Trametes versicolor FP-101664 SS1]|uniref:eukaryotic translation initiation factor 2 beta n=1 Tax=Trametes versicolor (strain FP-101664) TaxID=717944 RepID=UPI0004623333|nr:eukaryotic translation initiation factor 2 beta [Trametes versicolor FP-101664 SS1]EIW53213.1 eukaryotic translation initiation factor 2 beta [Trametes versicolor FP-101664 SS1]
MASEEPLFDPSLKKRKKKTVAFSEDPLGADADPTTPAPADIDNVTTNGDKVDMGPTTAHELMKQNETTGEEAEKKEEDDLKAMFGDLKKKKKKKDIPLDLAEDNSGTSTPVVAAAPSEDLDFSDLKKKKKKSSKKAALDLEAFEKELNQSKTQEAEEDEGGDEGAVPELDEGELGDDPFAGTGGGEAAVGLDTGSEPWLKSDRDYTYEELLHRFYAQLHASNPALLTSVGKRYTIAPPQLLRDGNKKSIFANVSDICKRMHRQPEHVIQYMFAEMGTTGSVDGSGRLVIKGRFQQKQVEHVLRRYIVEYVTCKTCKSPDTILTKENRIFFMACESCGSRRSVNAIKTGFQAQVGRRSKNKTG